MQRPYMSEAQHVRCQNTEVWNILSEYARPLSLFKKLQEAIIQIFNHGKQGLTGLARQGRAIAVHDNQLPRLSVQRDIKLAHNKVKALEWIGDLVCLSKDIEVQSVDLFTTCQQDIFFAGENIVDESGADFCRAGDVRHTRAMKAFATEEILCRADNLFAARAANGFCAHAYSHFVYTHYTTNAYRLSLRGSFEMDLVKEYHILIEHSIEVHAKICKGDS